MRRLRLVAALAASSLVLGALGAGSASADSPSKRYRDPNAKFSFRVFQDWDPVPLEAEGQGIEFGGTSKFQVVKYVQRGAEKRGVMAAMIMAYRLGGGTVGIRGPGETTPGDGGGEDSFAARLRQLASQDDPKSMRELFNKVQENYGWGGICDPKQAKAIKSKDDVPGQMWVLERKNERWPDSQPDLLVFACWKKGDSELGLWLVAPSETKKKFEQGFQAVAKSFMFFDPQAEDVKSLDVLKDLPIPAKKKRQIERGLVKGWDVLVSPKKNYVIIYNTKGKRNDMLAKIISERIERIREQVYEVKFPPAEKIDAISIVRICGDEAEYRHYGGPGGSAGYWSSDTEELVFYDASPKKAPDDDTLAVLYHEAFHQFIHYSVGEVDPHSWFNEGTGDYFAGAKYSGGKFTIRPFNWRVGTIQTAIRHGASPYDETTDSDGDPKFQFDRAKEGYSPLKAFVRMSQGDYYNYAHVSYAQGWSFIYFLREAVPKNPAWNAKWGKILETYFDVLKREANKDKPLKKKPDPKDDPGDDDPGMDDPPSAPGDDPGMGDPGMTDPGMDDPGMDEPGMDGEPPSPPGGGDGGEDDPGIPRVFRSFMGSSRALRVAIEEAFKGVDYDELEAAWRGSTLKVK
jgi:hypothetical protein